MTSHTRRRHAAAAALGRARPRRRRPVEATTIPPTPPPRARRRPRPTAATTTGRPTRRPPTRRLRRGALRDQQGRRQDHLLVELRLRRLGLDRRRRRRQGEGLLRGLCLDVELVPGFSTTNYPLVAAGHGPVLVRRQLHRDPQLHQSGGEYVAFVNYGKAPIEALVTPDGGATELSAAQGQDDRRQGRPAAVARRHARRGRPRAAARTTRRSCSTASTPCPAVQRHRRAPGLQVERAGPARRRRREYHLFDPAADDIPGTFGLLYTSKEFAEEHPTVVEDFARAALKGMEDAIADPAAAVALSVEQIDAAGNQNFLTEEGETYRWQQELADRARTARRTGSRSG